MPRVAVVDVLGHTLQVTETDEDTLVIHEILPAPFLCTWEKPERVAADRASTDRAAEKRRQARLAQRAAAASAYRPVPKDAAERMRQSGEAGR